MLASLSKQIAHLTAVTCNTTHTSQLVWKNKTHSKQACFQQQVWRVRFLRVSRDSVLRCQVKTEVQRHLCHSTDSTQIKIRMNTGLVLTSSTWFYP